MKRRGDGERPPIPHWLMSPEGKFLDDDTATLVRWCEENGWRKLDVLREGWSRRQRAFGGITL